MIFVTVGTHEQPFDRLVRYMDDWSKEHLDEEVVIQTGFSTYEPKNATWSKLLPYKRMLQLVEDARIVVTHGGPSSFLMPLQIGKIPVVVPRKHEFDEHVNDHQVEFSNFVAERQKNIIVVEDIEMLGETLENYENTIEGMNIGISCNNKQFCEQFEAVVNTLKQ